MRELYVRIMRELYERIIVPTVMYGSESWSMKVEKRDKLDQYQCRLLLEYAHYKGN